MMLNILFFTIASMVAPNFAQTPDPCSPLTRPVLLTDCNGTLTSPNYPGFYGANADCQWLISSSQGAQGVVLMDFSDFYTYNALDVLYIYDGPSVSAPLLVSLASTYSPLPGPFMSTQQTVFIRFTTDASLFQRGFNMSYRLKSFGPACLPQYRPANLTSDTAVLTTPNYPGNYPTNVDCRWLITSSVGPLGVIILDFNYLNTQATSDPIRIYDGDSITAPLLATLSGVYASPPKGYKSSQQYMLIQFTSNAAVNSRGFSAVYKSTLTGGECSPLFRPRNMLGDSGTISSPSYPDNYNDNADCQWLIAASDIPYGVVTLDFDDFYTVAGDVVYIYDGRSNASTLITSISGNPTTMISGYTSTQPYMFIRFVSNSATSNRGFTATYRTTTSGGACSASSSPAFLRANVGTITSPNHPNNYYDSADCKWIIQASRDLDVIMVYIDSFNTQLTSDALTLRDGQLDLSPLIVTLSGTYATLPGPYSSMTSSLYARFITNVNTNSAGFSISYRTYTTYGACSANYRPAVLTSDYVTFVSPNYPDLYHSNADCIWLIQANLANQVVKIQFDYFYTYNANDNVYIYNGNSVTAPQLARLYGTYTTPPGPYSSTQRFLTVRFTSDASLSARGFSAKCTSVEADPKNPCSSTGRPQYLLEGDGSISSPNYPGNYSNNADCHWLIAADTEYDVVTLTFNYFYTQPQYDAVWIFDGNSTAAPVIARLQGSKCPAPGSYVSSQRYMYVTFASDSSVNVNGFSASIKTLNYGDACSQQYRPRNFTDVYGRFTSPNYPDAYHNNGECQWLITSPLGANWFITLDFDAFSTQTDADYLYVYDGSSVDDSLIAKLHGSYPSPPGGITGTKESMLIRFTSDSIISSSGFSAKYRVLFSGGACSSQSSPRYLTGYYGTFSAPSLSNYANNADCSWLIESAAGPTGVVALSFKYFNTQPDADFLYIRDGASASSPIMDRLSGNYCSPPSGYTSTQRYMFVRFTSDSILSYQGFSATYSSKSYGGACSPLTGPLSLTQNGGTITSPNYPLSYYNNADCSWLLQPSNALCEVVTLNFEYFSTENGLDFVYVYDGDHISVSLLAELTGTYSLLPTGITSTQPRMLVRFITNSETTLGGFSATFTSTLSPTTNDGNTTSLPDVTREAVDPCLLPTPCYYGERAGYPEGCQLYYECSSLGFWLIESCHNEQQFDIVSLSCVPFGTASCQPACGPPTELTTTVGLADTSSSTYSGPLTSSTTMYVSTDTPTDFASSTTLATDFISSSTPSTISPPSEITRTQTTASTIRPSGNPCSADGRPADLTGESGAFSSPNYPNSYPDNSDCQWRITATDTNGVIMLTFNDFSTESCCDKVYVYDGDSLKAPLIASFSGSSTTVVNSTQQFMYIRFISDLSDSERGFSATFTSFAPRDPCSPFSRPLELTLYSGMISSSNYPNDYNNNADCQWRIISTELQGFVELDFDYFNTEACCDRVSVYDGDSAKSNLITTLFGTLDPPPRGLVSTQRYLFVRFTSDETDTAGGFSAFYTSRSIGDPCSPESRPLQLEGYTGTITSSNYPDQYSNNADCQWRIIAPDQYEVVDVSFTDFKTEACCDIVEIFDGDNTKAPLLATLSGLNGPDPIWINSTQRFMFIRFTTDDSVTFGGFRATFYSLDRGDPCSPDSRPLEITGSSGTFSSQNYPADYLNDADCQWRILSAISDGIIIVDFVDFNTESCCDYLEMYDGSTTKAPLIATLSGTFTTPPGGYRSTQRYMFVQFTSDSSVVRRGFSARYVSEPGTTANHKRIDYGQS